MYRRGASDEDATRLLADLATVEEVVEAVADPCGDRVAFTRRRGEQVGLWTTDFETTTRLVGADVLTRGYTHHDQRSLDWFPDGSALAYCSVTADSADIWRVDAETGEQTRLTRHAAADRQPQVSPSGDRIAFVTDLAEPGSLATVAADGNGADLLRDDEYVYYDPRWVTDETLCAARIPPHGIPHTGMELVTVTIDGTVRVLHATDGKVFAPRPAPDGDAIAFLAEDEGRAGLYRHDGDAVTPLWTPTNADLRAPSWSDEGTLVVAACEDADTALYTLDPGGEPVRVTDAPGRRHTPFWSNGSVGAVTSTPTRPFRLRNESDGGEVPASRFPAFDRRLVSPESTWYESDDGVEVQAMVYLPHGFEEAAPETVPVVEHVHGGPSIFFGYEFDPRPQFLAAQGYAVVEPNYRGSDGFGRAYRERSKTEWDGAVRDVVTAVDALGERYPQIDAERAGLFGMSHGGYLTLRALQESDRFRAGATICGIADLESFVDDADDVGRWSIFAELGTPGSNLATYRQTSPIHHVDDIDAPLLVLHGEQDTRVPVSQSEELVEALSRHGKRHEFVRYEDEGHVLQKRESVVDAYSRIGDLFAKYLEPPTLSDD